MTTTRRKRIQVANDSIFLHKIIEENNVQTVYRITPLFWLVHGLCMWLSYRDNCTEWFGVVCQSRLNFQEIRIEALWRFETELLEQGCNIKEDLNGGKYKNININVILPSSLDWVVYLCPCQCLSRASPLSNAKETDNVTWLESPCIIQESVWVEFHGLVKVFFTQMKSTSEPHHLQSGNIDVAILHQQNKTYCCALGTEVLTNFGVSWSHVRHSKKG